MVKMLTIREFLKLACIGTLAVVLAACGSKPINVQVKPTVTKTFTPIATNTPEPTATNTPEATPTEAPKFTKENITIIPMEMADIPKLVEVADPINDQAQFITDIDKIWSVVQKDVLPNYSGPFITAGILFPDNSGSALMVDKNLGLLNFKQDMVPVASFKSTMEGEPVVGLMFLATDGTKTFPIFVVTNPDRGSNGTSKTDNNTGMNDVLKLLKRGGGSLKSNLVYGTEVFFSLPGSPDKDYLLPYDKKIVAINGPTEEVVDWVFKSTVAKPVPFRGKWIVTTWFGSTEEIN